MSEAKTVRRGPTQLPAPLHVEGLATSAYLPGNLVFKDGDNLTIGVAATKGQVLIAKENGLGQGGHIYDAFEIGSPLSAYVARPSLVFEVRCNTGLSLVDGVTLLERAASGQLKINSTGTAIFVARETVTTSAANQLVTVEAL